VLLADQDRTLWDRDAIAEALGHLDVAARLAPASATATSYRLQTTIAATHTTARSWEATDWVTILDCYDQLVALGDSPVVRVNRAVALSFTAGPAAALDALEPLAADPRLDGSHLFHAVHADLLRRLDDPAARHAYERALELAATPPERRFLERRLAELQGARPD
jgi:RNA polymerase sigma-70 factor, ECF subfamily